MTDETRNISVNVAATQAIRSLTSIGRGLDNLNTLVGKSDKQLLSAERQIQKYGEGVTRAANTISEMKAAQNQLASSLKSANALIAKQNSLLQGAATQVKSAKQAVKDMQAAQTANNKTTQSATLSLGQQLQANVENGRAISSLRKSLSAPMVSNANLQSVKSFVSTLSDSRISAQPFTAQQEAFQRFSGSLGLLTSGQLQLSNATTTAMNASKKQNQTALDGTNQNVALRYALYSVATTFGIVTAAGLKAYGDLFAAGIDYQKNIASVLRTSQVESAATFANSPLVSGGFVTQEQQATLATQSLSDAFLNLSSNIPVTTEDLTTIGTLASQMGIAASQVADFTQTTAEFSAATGISADESATGLARLAQLLPDVNGQYSNLASAILKTGVNSIATESQILKSAQNIAGIARVAGLSAKNVVALASGMSSLGITSELGRSTVTTSFTKILTATNNGAAAASKYAAVLGETGQQFITTWGKDAYGTYTKLLAAIANSKDPIGTLQDLGLASQRLTPTLLKMGQNLDVFNKSQKDTETGWKQNTELTRQFNIIAATTAAKVQVLQQAWQAFLVTIGGGAVDVIGDVAKHITDLLHGLSDLASTPFGHALATVIISIGLLGTALFGVMTAVALAGAAFLGFDYVVEQLGLKVGITGASISGMALATDKAAASALFATGKTLALKGALALLLNPLNLVIAALAVGVGAVQIDSWITAKAREVSGLSNSVKELEKELGNLKGGESTVSPLATLTNSGGKNALPSFNDLGSNGLFGGSSALPEWMVTVNRGLGSWAPSASDAWASIRLLDEELSKMATKHAPETVKELTALRKQWIASGQDASTFDAAFPDTISALDLVTGKSGAGSKALKQYADDQAEAAAQAQQETDTLQAQSDMLGLVTDQYTDAETAFKAYIQSIQTAGGNFFDVSDLLKTAYKPADTTGKVKSPAGGGLVQLQKDLNTQLDAFRKWSKGISQLTAEGAGALAQAFIEAGPSSQQAVTDALKLSPKARNQLNESFREAAFYASAAFANTFASQNAILADIYKKTLTAGGNPNAAVHDAISDLGKTDSLTAQQIIALEKKYKIHLDVDLNTNIDPEDITNLQRDAQDALNAKPIKVKTQLIPSPTFGNQPKASTTRTEYSVTEGSHAIVLKVAPDTKEGQKVLDAWRANEYQIPVKFKADVDTTAATAALKRLRALMAATTRNTVNVALRGAPFSKGGGVGIPGYANGGGPGMFRGPGTGTSDGILARVSNGEYINTAASVRYYGAAFFEALNRRQFPKYAGGGGVGNSNNGGSGATMNVNVVQNYPTTVDPIKKLKQDAENLVAGIWS